MHVAEGLALDHELRRQPAFAVSGAWAIADESPASEVL
jgi:hypothetical protein